MHCSSRATGASWQQHAEYKRSYVNNGPTSVAWRAQSEFPCISPPVAPFPTHPGGNCIYPPCSGCPCRQAIHDLLAQNGRLLPSLLYYYDPKQEADRQALALVCSALTTSAAAGACHKCKPSACTHSIPCLFRLDTVAVILRQLHNSQPSMQGRSCTEDYLVNKPSTPQAKAQSGKPRALVYAVDAVGAC